MLKSPICELFGIEHPILLAGMGGASTPELAAAVSNAGGLGIMGAAGLGPGQLREWIARCRDLTDQALRRRYAPAGVRPARLAEGLARQRPAAAGPGAGIPRTRARFPRRGGHTRSAGRRDLAAA